MKVAKTSKLQIFDLDDNVKNYVRNLDSDVETLFTLMQGRLRFGTGTDGDKGENLLGEFQKFTSHASANTEFSVTHGLGSIPIGRIILYQDKAGELYQGPTTGTNWTSTIAYFKSVGTSVTYLVFLIK